MRQSPPSHRLGMMMLVVLVSGISCLIYEVVWTRMLMLVFGTSTFAVSTVLAAYMAGLALGSMWFGHRADGRRRLLRTYGSLELGLGLYSLLLPVLLHALIGPYARWAGEMTESFYLRSLLRFGLGFSVLLPATTLIGGILPTAARWVLSRRGGIADGAGKLYSMNTLGSVAGTLLTGFLLIRFLGTARTTWFAASLNMLIGVTALSISLIRREAPQEARSVARSRGLFPASAYALLLLFALSGFAALAYQVLWTRILVFLLGNRIYAFATILAVFLAGLALGSLWIARRADRLVAPVRAFALIEVLIGLTALATLPVFARLSAFQQFLQSHFQPGWSAYLVIKLAITAAPILLPTLLMGATYPVVVRILVRDRDMIGRGIGHAAAWNTLGAILGAFAGGFVLAPLLNVTGSIRALAVLNALLGLAALIWLREPQTGGSIQRGRIIFASALVAVLLLLGFGPRHLILDPAAVRFPETVLYYEEGTTATVSVLTKPGDPSAKMLRINGVSEVPTDPLGMRVFKMLGHLPMLLHPDPHRVLVVTFGGGIASGCIAQHPDVRVDVVEICPEVLRAANEALAEENNHVLDSPAVRVHVEDGRNYLLTDRNRYDVLSCDATHPTAVDSWVLFTREFYRLVEAHLRPGGLFIQWIPMHELSDREYRTVIRTITSVFPHSTLWLIEPENVRGHTLLLAGPDEFVPRRDSILRALEHPPVRRDLERFGLADADRILGYLTLTPSQVAAYARGMPISTDDRPILAFPASPFRYKPLGEKVKAVLRAARETPPDWPLPRTFRGVAEP